LSNLNDQGKWWLGLLKSIAMAVALYVGGGTGSYIANTEMARDEAIWRYEVKEQFKHINEKLDDLDKRTRP